MNGNLQFLQSIDTTTVFPGWKKQSSLILRNGLRAGRNRSTRLLHGFFNTSKNQNRTFKSGLGNNLLITAPMGMGAAYGAEQLYNNLYKDTQPAANSNETVNTQPAATGDSNTQPATPTSAPQQRTNAAQKNDNDFSWDDIVQWVEENPYVAAAAVPGLLGGMGGLATGGLGGGVAKGTGAALGGMGGYYLGNELANYLELDKDAPKWAKPLTQILGAGLGGLAGYGLGNFVASE